MILIENRSKMDQIFVLQAPTVVFQTAQSYVQFHKQILLFKTLKIVAKNIEFGVLKNKSTKKVALETRK